MAQDPETPKKDINLNMPLDEFKKLTPEERREYKIKADEMDRKTTKGYDKAKKQDFKHGGSVKGKGKSRMDGIAIRGKTKAKQRSK